MRFGIGLPVDCPGVDRDVLFAWIHRVDESPFETMAVVDEIVSPNFESLTILAAAAAVTKHPRLMTVVIAGPTRSTALLAKQAATIDAFSGGRLSLGLGVGELVDDFAIVGVDLHKRGHLFDRQLALLHRIWSGEPMGESGRVIGPSPVRSGGPELLIGGWAPRAMARIGQFADGYVGAVLSEEMLSDEPYRLAEQSWREHKRAGRPAFVQNVYFALGAAAEDAIAAYLERAYAGSPDYDKQAIAAAMPKNDREIRQMVSRLEAIGADSVNFHPITPVIDQFDRLEQVVG